MRSKYLLLLLAVIFSQYSFSQNAGNLTGIIKDTTENKLVENAVVAIVSQGDSMLLHFTRTAKDGTYSLPGPGAGKYIFMVMHPSFADYVDDITLQDANKKMPLVSLTPKSKLLEAIILKTGTPIRIKGDTTIYTADSFKVSANANVEELLKKMPGIQVDKDGKIKAMGESVEKVLVDGEEFFGEDPGMAVKNLRADAVKEVQVFKKKSEQAEFTGIDDGQSKQTINLKLKDNKRSGYFGKIDMAGGLLKNIDDRYNTNLMFSSFKGKRKLSAFILNGNTGQDGLSWQDMEKFGGNDMNFEMTDEGGMMFFSGGGGSSDGEPYINPQNGFITNTNAGLQYNNKWGKNSLNLSPKFNSQVYDNNRTNFLQTQIRDSILNQNSQTQTHINRYNFKTKGTFDLNIDSSNSLKLTLNANIYHTESEERTNSITTGESGNFKNSSDINQQNNSDKQSFSSSLLYKHKFKKDRRTLSVNADLGTLSADAGNFLQQQFTDNQSGVTEINQFKDISNSTSNVATKLVYTEPLTKKFSLEIGHELSYTKGKNNQQTYNFTPATGKFDERVDTLSNNFNQQIVTNKPYAKIAFSSKKIKYNIGMGVGYTHFNLDDISFNKSYVRDFTNLFPSAFLTYIYKSNHSLRFNYNGRTTQPTLNQLQPLRNNNNPYNQYIGNPDLKQSFTNSFNISHNGYDFLKDRWMYQSLNVRMTSNAITNNRILDPVTGFTIIQPVNTGGNYNISFWSGLGMKIKKLDLRMDLNPNINYSKFIEVVNGLETPINNLSTGLRLSFSKSKDKKYDFGIGDNFEYTKNSNSSNNKFAGARNSFITNTLNLNAKVYYKKVWALSSDLEYIYRQKTSDFSQDLTNKLWNARLERTFKKDEFTAYFMVRDILNQNIGITRNFNGINYSEEINDRLQRYFMVGFTWNFKNKAPKAEQK